MAVPVRARLAVGFHFYLEPRGVLLVLQLFRSVSTALVTGPVNNDPRLQLLLSKRLLHDGTLGLPKGRRLLQELPLGPRQLGRQRVALPGHRADVLVLPVVHDVHRALALLRAAGAPLDETVLW
jgi:hypothetical protein